MRSHVRLRIYANSIGVRNDSNIIVTQSKVAIVDANDTEIHNRFMEARENPPVNVLENLRSLTLTSWAFDWGNLKYPDVFDVPKFPGLRSLCLQGAEMDFELIDIWDPSHVSPFLNKMEHEFCLEYLSIAHISISLITFEWLFKATSHVTTLDVHIYDNYEHFKELTIDRESSQNCLPQWSTLALELGLAVAMKDGQGEAIDPDVLDVFLESRMRCAPSDWLNKIVLYGWHWDEVSDETPFVQVIQYLPEGLLLESRVVTVLRSGKADDDWMERDPELQDWLEVNVTST